MVRRYTMGCNFENVNQFHKDGYMNTAKKRLLFLTLGVIAVLLVGCGTKAVSSYPMASAAKLPDFLNTAPAHTREAYQFAMANMKEMEKYPCYCGCKYLGHLNLLDCYIKAVEPGGIFSFDTHANGCGVCVDITQDVMRMLREGHSSKEIRAYIDAEYSKFGPPTDTALPSA